jgi:predicted dehydrogenase
MSLNLDRKTLTIHRKGVQEMFPGIPEITRERESFGRGDALRDQIEAFLQAIINKTPPIVSGEDGKRALATAIKITEIVRHSNELFPINEHIT